MIYVAVALVVLAVIVVVKGLVIVPQAETRIVERLGKYHKTLDVGLNFMIPILDQLRPITWRYETPGTSERTLYTTRSTTSVDLRETVFDFPGQSVITADNATVTINAVLYFRIIDARLATYSIANLPDALEKLTQTTLRNIMGEMDLERCLTSRDEINGRLQVILDEVGATWGVKVTRVELQDITPPDDVRRAMEQLLKANRDKRAAVTQAEGERESSILRAEGARQSAVLQAQGEAEARLAVAEAEAKAIERVKAALEGSDPAAYLLGLRSIESFERLAESPNQKLVFVPTEATKVFGALGALREVMKD